MAASQPFNFVLMSNYITSDALYGDFVEYASKKRPLDNVAQRVTYQLDEENRVMELIGFETLAELTQMLKNPAFMEDEQKLLPHLDHAVRREIIELHTEVRPIRLAIPTTEQLQVRYIEVPSNTLLEYFDWRERTIFEHVRNSETVDGFLAYQSMVSYQPGVTFFVEYHCETEELHNSFNTPHYKDIVKQAAPYIVGGSKNLYTRFFKRTFIADALAEQVASL